MRLFVAVLGLTAVSASAQTLTVSADFTFQLTSKLPLDALGLAKGDGVITLGCSPCANPANTQKYGFDDLRFLYEKAPADPYAARVGGISTPGTTTTLPYSVTQLPVGVRLFPRLTDAVCVCGNNAQSSTLLSVDKPAFTIPPFLSQPSFVWRGATVETYKPDAIPAGAPVRWQPLCEGKPKGAEVLRVKAQGAGVDAGQDFASKDAAFQAGLTFTPTAPGMIALTCSLEPYGALSNEAKLTVIDSGSGGGGGGGGGTSGTAGGSGTEEAPQGGCASIPAAGVLCLAALLGLLRRSPRA